MLLSIALTLASSRAPVHACSLALAHSSSLALAQSCALLLARACSLALAQACSLALAHTWSVALDLATDLALDLALDLVLDLTLDLAVDLVPLGFAFETLALRLQTSRAFLAALRRERGLRGLGDRGRVLLEERRPSVSRDRPPFLLGFGALQTLK